MDKTNYGLDIVHEDLLDLLKVFDSICRTNHVQYSLYAGSLLGAVREKGFIPWDDDLDVILVYDEYIKLEQAVSKCEDYYIDLTDAWVPRFRRKRENNGAFIDLFWLVNAPESNWLFNYKVLRLKVLQGMLKRYNSEKKLSFIYRVLICVLKAFGSLFPRSYLLNIYNQISLENESDTTSLYSISNAAFSYLKYRFQKDIYGDCYHDIPFESITARTIDCWDYVLRTVYGSDYMTPPDADHRVRTHANQLNK